MTPNVTTFWDAPMTHAWAGVEIGVEQPHKGQRPPPEAFAAAALGVAAL